MSCIASAQVAPCVMHASIAWPFAAPVAPYMARWLILSAHVASHVLHSFSASRSMCHACFDCLALRSASRSIYGMLVHSLCQRMALRMSCSTSAQVAPCVIHVVICVVSLLWHQSTFSAHFISACQLIMHLSSFYQRMSLRTSCFTSAQVASCV